MRGRLLLLVLALSCPTAVARADCGSIPFKPHVAIFEPNQRALIAFNVVELGKETLTKEAIQYRFKTGFLYYPLKISRTDTGETTVTLLVVSPRLVKLPDLGPTSVRLAHDPLPISPQELREIDKNLAGLLTVAPQRLLRTWKITAPLASFQKDVVTTW